MPRRLDPLFEGYRRFRHGKYQDQADLYATLAEGQSPRAMVIACADSRVDPAMIFDVEPGDLFVVRNVANLAPPHEVGGGRHGVSAALEFAVTALHVRAIIVLGHAGCGGIAACVKAAQGDPVGEFIAPWMEIAADARRRVLDSVGSDAEDEVLGDALEHEAIGASLENLMTFPFVAEAVASGEVTLHGAWFDVRSGELHWRDPETGAFAPLSG